MLHYMPVPLPEQSQISVFLVAHGTIQDRVQAAAKQFARMGFFSIFWLQLFLAFRYGCCYSYKQIRNALFRTRAVVPLAHVCYGWYEWLI